MSVGFKNPDGTYNWDGDIYARHTNPSGEEGGMIDVRITVGENVTVRKDLVVAGSGILPDNTVIDTDGTFGDVTSYIHDVTLS